MTTTRERVATPAGPERLCGQGLDPEQYESGDRAIYALLTDATAGPQTDLVITFRDDAYEVWASRGMIRFQRFYAGDGHGYEYRVIEQIGENPVANQDRKALATIDDELAASKASGFPGIEANTAYVEPEHNAYPFAYERIAQLFDSPNAPDLAVNPKAYAFGQQPGQHGALDVTLELFCRGAHRLEQLRVQSAVNGMPQFRVEEASHGASRFYLQILLQRLYYGRRIAQPLQKRGVDVYRRGRLVMLPLPFFLQTPYVASLLHLPGECLFLIRETLFI